MADHGNAPKPTTVVSKWNHRGTPPDLTPVLRALVVDELRGERLTSSRYRRIEEYARAMGLSRRQCNELFEECFQEVTGRDFGSQLPKTPWKSLLIWLSSKLRATLGKTPPRDP